MAADQARAALMRLRDAVLARRTPYADDPSYPPAQLVSAVLTRVLSDIATELAALPAEDPATCDLCKGPVSDSSDHGLGECAPICPTCDGSGVAEEPAPASAGLVEAAAFINATIPGSAEWTPKFIASARLLAEAERARKPQPDERDKTIAELLQMHNDTERVLDESGLLHDVKAALPDQVRAVCKEVVELREKLASSERARQVACDMAAAAGSTARREKHRADQAEAEVAELRNLITAAATQIRVAHEKHGEDAPMSAQEHYEEALGMLATHAGEWSPECAKLRDFTTMWKITRENSELREKVADLHTQIDGMAEDYQTCARACAAEEERAEKAELEVVELRERATKRETLIDAMRSVLRDTAKAAGCSVTDATTDEFLAYLPGEVALLASNSDWEKAYGALLIAKEREEKRADAAEAALADARKEGLRELRETCVSQRERWERIGDWARVHEIEWFMRSIDRLLAADTAPSKPEPDHPQYDADATLRDFVRINDGRDFSDMRDEALAELCRRALGVTGGSGRCSDE